MAAIPQERYVKITSTNAGDSAITDRELGGLIFTMGKGWTGTEPMPVDSALVCYSVDQVKKYFSATSKEVGFATRYFAYQSPSGTTPASLTIARQKVASEGGDLLIYKLKENATSTVVTASLGGTAGTTVPADSVAQDTDGNLYTLNSDVGPLVDAVALQIKCTLTKASGTTGEVTIPKGTLIKWTEESGVERNCKLDSETDVTFSTSTTVQTFTCTQVGNITCPTSATEITTATTITGLSSDVTFTEKVKDGVSLKTGDFTCMVTGPIACPSHSLTIIPQEVSGWTSVDNDNAGTLGHDVIMAWYTPGNIEVTAPIKEAPVDSLTRMNTTTNNFGSFAFVDTDEITCKQIKNVAIQNKGYNYKYLFSLSATNTGVLNAGDDVIVNSVNIGSLNTYLRNDNTDGINGTCIVLGDGPLSAEMPMAVFAATNYDGVNTATFHMFKQFSDETATVTDENTADSLDSKYINYNGKVQINGVERAFYQRGVNFDGESTAVYCNEVWLKSRISTDLMDLLLSTERIPANADGELMIYGIVTSAAEKAVTNGVIEKNKTLTTAQKTKIYQLTGDSEAWFTVQQAGYVCSVEIKQNGSEYQAYYKLVYSKGDAISYIEGTDILI